MNLEFGPDQMKQLAELLKPPDDQPVEDLPSAGYNISTANTASKINKNEEKVSKILENPKTIEEFEEEQEKQFVGSCLDNRKLPVYDITYRQAVSAEDVFLQMGPKTGATASCENLIVKIQLPGEAMQHMDLKVTHSQINLEGRLHWLQLPLPQPIDPDCSKASWDSSAEVMTLTLKMAREFDYVNF